MSVFSGRDHYPEEAIWLVGVYVDIEHRHKKVATKLIEAAVELCSRFGIRDILLFTRTDGTLYERLGWKLTKSFEYQENKTILMRKSLPVNQSVFMKGTLFNNHQGDDVAPTISNANQYYKKSCL